MDQYAKQALEEYSSQAAHAGGVDGRLFWNINSTQFIFAPSFQFPHVPSCKKYRFTATDKNGVAHTFDADSPIASLAPIWGEIPTGFVTLTVHSLGKYSGEMRHLIGARTFFKCDPFPGREALPKRARSYREAAIAATKFVLMPIISAVLIVVGLFTDILATWIGCAFLGLYVLLCLMFDARVAAASDMVDESEGEQ